MEHDCRGWTTPGDFPFLRIPFANSVNLQWTVRDGQLVNSPVALVVVGDIVKLRPGQVVFMECRLLPDPSGTFNADGDCCGLTEYSPGQIFLQSESSGNDRDDAQPVKDASAMTGARMVALRSCAYATVTRTPIIEYLDSYLQHQQLQAGRMAVSVPERYIEFSLNCLIVFVFLLHILQLIVDILFARISTFSPVEPSASLLLGLPIQLPLLLSLTLANAVWSLNRLRYRQERQASPHHPAVPRASSSTSSSSSSDHTGFSQSLLSAPPPSSEDPRPRDWLMHHLRAPHHAHQLLRRLLFSMANLTSICCVDKKGILADPIATPEKMFFYRRKHHRHRPRSNSMVNLEKGPPVLLLQPQQQSQQRQHSTSINTALPSSSFVGGGTRLGKIRSECHNINRMRSMTADDGDAVRTICSLNSQPTVRPSINVTSSSRHPIIDTAASGAVPIILDISRNTAVPVTGYRSPCSVTASFDDNKWPRYLSSLKPIGLNILLNNCNPTASERYMSFADNICAMHLKPPHKSQLTQRCICSLSSQIGFQPSATSHFSLATTFSVCRQRPTNLHSGFINKMLTPGIACDVYSPPVSNVFVTVVKETSAAAHDNSGGEGDSAGSYQMMSQGSGDLLLSLCDDYWDGRDICPLSAHDRTRILDFYNRNIFSAYCIAFAYSPVLFSNFPGSTDQHFILELNDEKTSIPEPVVGKASLTDSPDINIVASESHSRRAGSINGRKALGKHDNHHKPQSSTIPSTTTSSQAQEVSRFMRPQVFLGMVSLQADQVETDVIDCINRLEQACIRFVYFSMDNQLRSRVFAERLGLESGWNCHISLATEPPTLAQRTVSSNDETTASGSNLHTRAKVASAATSTKHISVVAPMTAKQSEDFKGQYNCRPRSRSTPTIYLSDTGLQEPLIPLDNGTRNSNTVPPKLDLVSPRPLTPQLPVSISVTREIRCATESPPVVSSISSNSDEDVSSNNNDSAEPYINEDPQDHFPDNKSKLPCGIKSIRPHLENVDNVPLQVSLFTDCNADVNLEMMEIMRDYGEIVCCCGSALNLKNLPLFAANDCAVAFVPNLHRPCWKDQSNMDDQLSPTNPKQHVFSLAVKTNRNGPSLAGSEREPMMQLGQQPPQSGGELLTTDMELPTVLLDPNVALATLTPLNVASRLATLPCGLLLHRRAGFGLVSFITESHHLVNNVLAMLAFYCLSCASLALVRLLGSAIVLALDFGVHNSSTSTTNCSSTFIFGRSVVLNHLQIIYNLYYHLPVLALLIFSRRDMFGKPLKQPSRKRLKVLTAKQCVRFVLVSCGRLFPSVLCCVCSLVWNLLLLRPGGTNWCSLSTRFSDNATSSPIILESIQSGVASVIGDFLFIQFNVYMVVVSFFYITIEKHFWKFSGRKNRVWSVGCGILLLVQCFYVAARLAFYHATANSRISVYSIIWAMLGPQLAFAICSIGPVLLIGVLANVWETRALAVEYRLWRLYFGTKLGMYSPV